MKPILSVLLLICALSIPAAAQVVFADEEEYVEPAIPLAGFPDIISKQIPGDVLPHRAFPENRIRVTNRLDTVAIFHKVAFQGLDTNDVFRFHDVDNINYMPSIAIRREKDWLLVGMHPFYRMTFNTVKVTIIELGKKKKPYLQVEIIRDGNVVSRSRSGYEEQWKTMHTLSLFDIEDPYLVLDNLFLGYTYRVANKSEVEPGIWLRDVQESEMAYEAAWKLKKAQVKFIIQTDRFERLEEKGEEPPTLLEPAIGVNRPLIQEGTFQLINQKFMVKK